MNRILAGLTGLVLISATGLAAAQTKKDDQAVAAKPAASAAATAKPAAKPAASAAAAAKPAASAAAAAKPAASAAAAGEKKKKPKKESC